MKDILKQALKQADQAEVVVFDTRSDTYSHYGTLANEVLSKGQQEICLRVIKDGRVGISHGTYKVDTEGLIANALRSAQYGGAAEFAFAPEAHGEGGKIYDQALADVTVEDLARESKRMTDYVMKEIPEILLNTYMDREVRKVSIVNSAGQDVSYDQTIYTVCLIHVFPGCKEGIMKELVTCRWQEFPKASLDELIHDYHTMQTKVQVPTRKMPVIFRAEATWSLLWRLLHGTSGDSVVNGVTPLADKIDTQIFPEFFTATDDPTRDWCPGSAPVDDEGVPPKRRSIIEKGVLKNFVFDLKSGTKHGCGSTGNGFKKTMWGRGIAATPTPRFCNLVIDAGSMSFEDMVKDAGECLVINDVIGFHSGNMLKGEFSMGVGIGAYYKDGKPVGRAVDTMVSGNIYDDFPKLKALGNRVCYNSVAYAPAFYFGELTVSGTGD